TSPRIMFERLAELELPWNRIHVFWVDERAVPPADPESNYRLAAESLLNHVALPPRNVHRIRAELAPEAAAGEYGQAIRTYFGLTSGAMPVFDVAHRGMGPDAHTASLFPGEPLIADRTGIAAAVYVEKKTQWRITLLPGPLEAARTTVMLVTGADKAEALRAVLGEPYDPARLPAQIASAGEGDVAWFLDQPAARLLPTA
ncbi:MAG TPA: 6-phosphogluconolactonase, partial [Bryobacteraceae bacterium]